MYKQSSSICRYELICELLIYVKLILNSYLKNKTGNGERFIAGFFVGERRNYILLFIKKGKNIVFRGVKFVRDYFTLYFYKLDKLDY